MPIIIGLFRIFLIDITDLNKKESFLYPSYYCPNNSRLGKGPVEYICTTSDLRAVSPTNFLCKFADDTYLIVPAANTPSIPTELQHIIEWAYINNFKLNNHKSLEMIVQQARGRKQVNEMPGINRVDKLTILGVTIRNTLSFNHHATA